MAKIKTNINLLLVFLAGLILFFGSFSNFFTNDDFFLLKISQAHSLKDFLGFFNLLRGPEGLGMYRPLSTQVYYFLGRSFSGLDPIAYRWISFGAFFLLVYLVYLLAKRISGSEKIALVSSLLYATSATHFAHLYYSATFQELALGIFSLASILAFSFYLEKRRRGYLYGSILFFILALMSKETAVILPLAMTAVYYFETPKIKTKLLPRKLWPFLSGYLLILAFYFYMRFAYYGFATGDSYIWNFSPLKAINTLGWYGLWSLNLPEMLVDFVGPGLKFNPNLFTMWSKEILPIFALFILETVLLAVATIRNRKTLFSNKKLRNLVFLLISWFVVTLLPVLFLPIHKFPYYLTLPLFAAVFFISHLLVNYERGNSRILFVVIWIVLSAATLNLTIKTHWITSGAKISERVYEYFQNNASWLKGYKNVVFYDLPRDKALPWLPTTVLKNSLSDNNFFKVFYGDNYTVKYGLEKAQKGEAVFLWARQFLGY